MTALACSPTEPMNLPPPPPPAPASPGFTVVPTNIWLPLRGTIQFRALAVDGTPVAVRWRIEPALAGTISADGLVTTTLCGNGTAVRIHATGLSDSARTATAHGYAARTGAAAAVVESLTNVPAGGRINPDSLAGAVAVHFWFSPSLRCFPLRQVLLERVAGSVATPIDSIRFDPGLMAPERLVVLWDTRTAPNGTYFLKGTALVGPATGVGTYSMAIRVSNP